MKNSILLFIALGCAYITAMANNPRQPRLHERAIIQSEIKAPLKVSNNTTADTTDLTPSIDYAQATYYKIGAKEYYAFLFENYDTEIPALRLESTAKSKTSIHGDYVVDLLVSSITIDEDPVSLSAATLSIIYVGENEEHDPEYAVTAVVTTTGGLIYFYMDTIAIYAYDQDNEYEPIVLKESTITDIESIILDKQNTKIINNGQLYILRDGKIYNAQGAIVE